MALEFQMTFAGVPFLNDGAASHRSEGRPGVADRHLTARRLADEIDRRLTFDYFRDFDTVDYYPGRNTGSLARQHRADQGNGPKLRLGDWYYPFGASKWSHLRMLASGAQVRAMLRAATPPAAAPLVVRAVPLGQNPAAYTVTSDMRLLCARPVSDAPSGDGVYVVTLVDERYYWQFVNSTLRPAAGATWAGLIAQVASDLGASVAHSAIEAVWGAPEQDSQLWCNQEPSADLLDALAHNVGRTLVRNLDGTYQLLTPQESAARAALSRPAGSSPRLGGDALRAGGPVALDLARDAVLPSSVTVTFPKWQANAGLFVDGRRGSDHFRDSYGDVLAVTVPIGQGPPSVSGRAGYGPGPAVQDTAKALVSGGGVVNLSELQDLARAVAWRHWEELSLTGLDECYPGTAAWSPDGLHDIVWAWSEMRQEASCRVMRRDWPAAVPQMQHGTPVPPGVPGPDADAPQGSVQSGGTIVIGGPVTVNPVASGGVSGGPTTIYLGGDLNVDLSSSLSQYSLAFLNGLLVFNSYAVRCGLEATCPEYRDWTADEFSLVVSKPVTVFKTPATTYSLHGIAPPSGLLSGRNVYATLVNAGSGTVEIRHGSAPASGGLSLRNPEGATYHWLPGTSVSFLSEPLSGTARLVGERSPRMVHGVSGDAGPGTLAEKLYSASGSILVSQIAGTSGTRLAIDVASGGGGGSVGSQYPGWVKVTKSYTDFSAAAGSNNIEIYSLPAKGVIHAAAIKHTQSFTGGAISAYTISVGYSSSPGEFTPNLNVFAAPADTGAGFQKTGSIGWLPLFLLDFGGATSIRAYANSTGGLLNAATQGSVDIYLLVSALP